MAKLTDSSPMPFGKHKNTPMEKVPARYLLWLWDEDVHAELGKPVHDYIKENFSTLETEATDYIVKHPPK